MKLNKKAGWKLIAVLLASGVAAFGQTYNTPPEAQAPNARAPAANQPPEPPPAQPGPGMINYVEGQASIDGQALSPSAGAAALNSGQVLDTSKNGFVEVLLTPGAFLRVGPNSELRMLGAGLADAKVQLLNGKALLEVDQLLEGTQLAVEMHGATTKIEKKGLYDFDMNQKAVKVLDGKVNVVEPAGNRILRRGHQVLLASAQPLKWRNFDRDAVQNQELYVWSKARSKDLMEANTEANESAGNGSGWFWAPYWNSYAFLGAYPYSPFGWGFYSPYAYSSPFVYRGYYIPTYRGHHGHAWRGGHRGHWNGGHRGNSVHRGYSNGGHHYSQQELRNRVHRLFSGKSVDGGSHGNAGGHARGGQSHGGHR